MPPAEAVASTINYYTNNYNIVDDRDTVTNVTGDATVATVVAQAEGQLGKPDLSENSDLIVTHR